MSTGPVLGIDLGTTNSVVAIADGGQARVIMDAEGRRMVPSVVSFQPDGSTLVGYEAREQRLLDAKNTVYAVKRLIGRAYDSPEVAGARERFAFAIVANKHGGAVVKVDRGTYALAEISAIVLRELRRIAEVATGEICERAVITVPANFNELQRSATKAAGKVAGIDVLRIVNEPTAAALAYGLANLGGSQRIAVYDLGGGTFDITILELEDDVFEVLATAGDTFLGGEDIDREIAERMSDQFKKEHGVDPRNDRQAFERLKAAAEWAKCQLSNEQVIELTVEELVTHKGRSLDLRFRMTREELEKVAMPWLVRSFRVCEEALRGAGARPSELTGVVLVGGSTRMPLCRKMVREYFGKEPRTNIDPDMVVAQGAAIHGYALGGHRTGKGTMPFAGAPESGVPKRRAIGRGLPKQPAFAPDDRPLAPAPPTRPARATEAPPAMPELPTADPVVVQKSVAVRTPRTTIERELDALSPPDEEMGKFDDLAPPPRSHDPFADVVPDDPFGVPVTASKREPTIPFSLDLRPSTKEAPAPFADLEPPWSPPSALEDPLPLPEPELPPRPPPPPPQRAQLPATPPVQTIVQMPERPPPLLLDVTPHSLGVETAGGYCRRIIAKNAPVPTEQMGTFTTAKDDQSEVRVRVCQGEDEHFDKNEVLGEVILDQLPARARGQLLIEVTFILDADGTLGVEARDAQSGRVQRTRINLRGGLSQDDIAAMRQRSERELKG
jgi:molecular chaperone DnaK